MNNVLVNPVIALLLCCFLVIPAFRGCDSEGRFFEREYLEDLYIPLQDESEKLIIKEWGWLMGSGEDVYYQKDDDKPIYLGDLTGGDDGYCPFADGKYEIIQDGRSVTIKWSFRGDLWKDMTFELPE